MDSDNSKNERNLEGIDAREKGSSSISARCVFQNRTINLDIRRAVLDWRDEHIENIELCLWNDLHTLFQELDEIIDTMSINDLIHQKNFSKSHLEPVFKKWEKREVVYLINAAQKDLAVIFKRALEIENQDTDLKHENIDGLYTDAVIAAVATSAGIAAMPTVAGLSVTSAAGIMGVFGVTAISWPVLVIGAAVVTLLLATGGLKAVKLKSKAIEKFRNKLQKSVEKQILGYSKSDTSTRHRLQSRISKAADEIILEIDRC